MREIPNFPHYFATEDGRVFSNRTSAYSEIKQRLCRGYFVVTLKVGRLRKKYSVHRLVALAFHEETYQEHLQVRHLNGNSTDNSKSNLAWGTFKDNASDAIAHGTLGKGMASRNRKLDDESVIKIRSLVQSGAKVKALACEYKVHPTTIYKIAQNKRWVI